MMEEVKTTKSQGKLLGESKDVLEEGRQRRYENCSYSKETKQR